VGSNDPVADALYITDPIIFCRAYLLEFFGGAFALGLRLFTGGFHWRTCRKHRTIPAGPNIGHRSSIAFAETGSLRRAVVIAAGASIIEFG